MAKRTSTLSQRLSAKIRYRALALPRRLVKLRMKQAIRMRSIEGTQELN